MAYNPPWASWANVTTSVTAGIPGIVIAAGGTPSGAVYENGILYVSGVSQSALNAAVAAYNPSVPLKASLLAYANGKLTNLMAIPRSYGPLGSGGPTIKCDATTLTGADLAGLNAWGSVAPTATTSWVDDFGAVTTLTGAQALALAGGVIAYGQSVYNALGMVAIAIAAGTVTTQAQIDAASWPT